MTEKSDIPFPILFNPFKHHLNYILGILNNTSPELILNLLVPLCNNYIDIYIGKMTPEVIGNEIISILKLNWVLDPDDFVRWVNGNNTGTLNLETSRNGLSEKVWIPCDTSIFILRAWANSHSALKAQHLKPFTC